MRLRRRGYDDVRDDEIVEEREVVRDNGAMRQEVVSDTTPTRRAVYADDVDVVDHGGRSWYSFDLPGRINTVFFALLAALETVLALRFFFKLYGANPNSGFVDFIYDLSWPFVKPFDTAFSNRTWDQGIVEVNTLLAMGIYALIYAVIALLVAAIVPRLVEYDDGASSRTVHRRRMTHSTR